MESVSTLEKVSSTKEDYLEQILDLIKEKGYARVVDMASRLNISQASVTSMIQRLDAGGLVKYEKYRGVILTEKGTLLARNITKRHKILSDFLSLFRLEEDTVYRDVEGMEHHISPPTVKAIAALTKQIRDRPEILEAVDAAINHSD